MVFSVSLVVIPVHRSEKYVWAPFHAVSMADQASLKKPETVVPIALRVSLVAMPVHRSEKYV